MPTANFSRSWTFNFPPSRVFMYFLLKPHFLLTSLPPFNCCSLEFLIHIINKLPYYHLLTHEIISAYAQHLLQSCYKNTYHHKPFLNLGAPTSPSLSNKDGIANGDLVSKEIYASLLKLDAEEKKLETSRSAAEKASSRSLSRN